MSRVFVLGSGFSVPAGLPLERDILKDIFYKSPQRYDISALKKWLQNNFFPAEKEWIESRNFGEILSRIDLINYYRPLREADYQSINRYKKILINRYRDCLTIPDPKSVPPIYTAFVRQLQKGDALVTFNHDLLVEYAFQRADIRYSYCIQERSLRLPLLKLHGSLNMFYCPACKRAYLGLTVCNHCLVPLEPLLIAPTFFKSYNFPALRRLWFHAFQCLSGCTAITFIGYSPAKEDLLAYQLFDFARRVRGRVPVLIVNGARADIDIFRDIYGRDVINTSLTFEKYMELAR